MHTHSLALTHTSHTHTHTHTRTHTHTHTQTYIFIYIHMYVCILCAAMWSIPRFSLQHTATYCNTLQHRVCVAVCVWSIPRFSPRMYPIIFEWGVICTGRIGLLGADMTGKPYLFNIKRLHTYIHTHTCIRAYMYIGT